MRQVEVPILPGKGWVDIPDTELQVEVRLSDQLGMIWIRKRPVESERSG